MNFRFINKIELNLMKKKKDYLILILIQVVFMTNEKNDMRL